MQERGLRIGHLVALAGAAAVVVALWLPWYAVLLPDALRRLVDEQGPALPPGFQGFANQLAASLPAEVHGTGWEVFSGADVALAAAALVVGALLLAAAGALGPSIRVDRALAAQVATVGGGVIAMFIVWKLLDPPVSTPYVSPLAGPWIALTGAVLMCAGGWAAGERLGQRRGVELDR